MLWAVEAPTLTPQVADSPTALEVWVDSPDSHWKGEVGPGHPDDGPASAARNIVGVAPVPGTKHEDRLMRSGHGAAGQLSLEEFGKLLVKAEWDEVEEWMDEFVDAPEPPE